jgi:hypothetical protein
MLSKRAILSAVCGCVALLSTFAVLGAELSCDTEAKQPALTKAKPQAATDVTLPAPPARVAGAAAQSKTCLECHEEIGELLKGDKHVADDFHCVVCHGPSKAHVEAKVEGTLPDRVWRRWLEDENRYQWRMKNASLEIAKYCGSCHARKEADRPETKRIHWDKFLDTGHGLGVSEGNHDAPTCADCHGAHGVGREPWTDQFIVERCSLCHGDKEMAKRNGLDPKVVEEFRTGKHGDMVSAPAAKKTSCLPCHKPH